jgi:hypothetical protein
MYFDRANDYWVAAVCLGYKAVKQVRSGGLGGTRLTSTLASSRFTALYEPRRTRRRRRADGSCRCRNWLYRRCVSISTARPGTGCWLACPPPADGERSVDMAGVFLEGHQELASRFRGVGYARVSSSTGMVRTPAVWRSYSAKPG